MDDVVTTAIDPYLRTLWEYHGSDLLLVAGAPPTVRIDGVLRPISGEERLTPAQTDTIVTGMLPPRLTERLAEEREIDFSFGWGDDARFRGNAFHQRGSLGVALRLIPRAIPDFAELGLPRIVEEWATLPQGLVLV